VAAIGQAVRDPEYGVSPRIRHLAREKERDRLVVAFETRESVRQLEFREDRIGMDDESTFRNCSMAVRRAHGDR